MDALLRAHRYFSTSAVRKMCVASLAALGCGGVRTLPTAPLAAGSLIASYGVVAATGSRPLGGAVLAVGGLCCIRIWMRRHDARTAAQLAGVGFAAFVASHVLALAIGAWPSVLIVAAITAVATWALADSQLLAPQARGLAFRPPAR
jgi:hypothetical protein